MVERYDAVVVGSGPNGLAAAVELARHDLHVLVVEGRDEIGGGARTAELTLPGFRHDVCSAAHPFGPASPFLSALPLEAHGLEWVTPPSVVAHPLDDGSAAIQERGVHETAARLGGQDGLAYRRVMGPLVDHVDEVLGASFGPVLRMPEHPVSTARFGLMGMLPATRFARRFDGVAGRALVAGLAAHTTVPLSKPFTTAVGLALALGGHRNGWPLVHGGSAALTGALASHLATLGGEVRTGHWVRSLADLPEAQAVLLDLSPKGVIGLAGDRLPSRLTRRLRAWRYGPASFKLDLALSDPVPWKAEEVDSAGTVHVGGTFEEIADSEQAAWDGNPPERPFVLVTQPTLFDAVRAPAGHHTLWAYCHVPEGWDGDATEAILAQIERFAPGFRDTILGEHVTSPAALEAMNPNLVNGTIAGGALTIGQLLGRPRYSPVPHALPVDGLYLCSSSTPPGAGTHGMCGYHAAHAALRRTFGRY